MAVFLITPHEMALHIATQLRTKRLSLNLSQKTLSERSSVSYGVIKKFEHTGQISLKSLLKLALTLGSMKEFEYLFSSDNAAHENISLDSLIKEKNRKRGRK